MFYFKSLYVFRYQSATEIKKIKSLRSNKVFNANLNKICYTVVVRIQKMVKHRCTSVDCQRQRAGSLPPDP